jgi:hypothetical protein
VSPYNILKEDIDMADPFTPVATGLSSVSAFVIKLCEYTYALRAVDQQTEAYLTTAKHAWENIQTCRRLLQLRQEYLPAAERKDYERVLSEAKTAAEEVARLLEPARVDVESDGQLRFSTRMLWVLRDDPAIVAALRRLNLVHTTLTQNISALRLMQGHNDSSLDLTKSHSSGRDKLPSYEASELLHWKRQTRGVRNLRDSFPKQLPAATEAMLLTPDRSKTQRPDMMSTKTSAEHLPSFRIDYRPSPPSVQSSPSITGASSALNDRLSSSSSGSCYGVTASFNVCSPPSTDPLPLRPTFELDPTRLATISPLSQPSTGRNSWLHHQASRLDMRMSRHFSTGPIGLPLSHSHSFNDLHSIHDTRQIAELGAGSSRSLSVRLPRFEWEADAEAGARWAS